MNTFLIIYLFISVLSLGMGIATHGEERKPQNAWNSVLAFILGTGLVLLAYFTK